MKRKVLFLTISLLIAPLMGIMAQTTFTAQTIEGWDMVFTILDETAKTCQVGYIEGDWDKTAVDREAVKGPVTIPETVNGYTVVKIGKHAFHNIYQMTSVTIPNTVTSLDHNAFSYCGDLTSFELPASVTTIGDCALSGLGNLTSLKVASGNIFFDSRDNCNAIIEKATNKLVFGCRVTTIPASVTEIGSWAFENITNCALSIPSTITNIDNYAFSGANNLTLQVEHTTPLEINEDVFQFIRNSTLRVPSGSKAAYAATAGWSRFDKIMEGNEGSSFTGKTTEGWDMVFTVLDENANTCQVGYLDGSWDKTAVNRNAVNGAVTIPQTVEGYNVVKIGRNAFENISGMTSITIPNTVTAIDEAAFNYCNGLTSFELPASVTNIGNNAFPGLNNATSIKVAEGNPNYDSRDNCNAIIETATKKLLYGCKNTIIPASVKEIGSNAFSGVLYNSTLLIPSTITKIDDYAFSGNNITLQVEHTTPLVISEYVFQDLQNSTLRVPAGSKAAYATATGWKDFENILEGNEGSTFTAKTTEGWDMVFTILDETEKTCQVGYINGSWDLPAVDRESVDGAVTIPETVNGYTIVKIGRNAFENINQISSVTIPNTVTAIDENAFTHCNGLTSFELPASVITIGNWALSGLNSATSIKVAEGNTKYDSRNNCNAIIETATNKLLFGFKNTIIPTSVTEIGSWAFNNVYNCTLTIPSTITTIDEFAFSGDNLTLQVEYTTPLAISENVFQGLNNSILRVPAGCKAAYAAATGWSYFDKIMEGNEGAIITAQTTEGWDMVFTVLDETAKTCQVGYINANWDKQAVDKEAVEGAVTIPETVNGYTVVKIGEYALRNVYRMTSVTIPNTVTSIDENAFEFCHGLISFELPASVTNIGHYALSGLSRVTSLKVAEGNSIFDSRDNCNAIIETATNKLLFGCKNSIIPASVTEIGSWAFNYINSYTLSIPSTITKIDDQAFNSGNNLTLQVDHTTPLVINEDAFAYLKNSTLRVPEGSRDAYAAATGWKNFETIMEGNEGANFTAKTTEGWDMVFTVLDDNAKTCQVGYINGSWDKLAVDKDAVNGAVTIPQTVEGYTVVKIGKYAFQNVYKMTSVTIPNTVTSIDEYAFSSCYNLISFELPASVITIGNWALSGLNSATSIKVAEGNTKYDSRNNCNAIIETATNKLLFGFKNTIIPTSVTEIGSWAFNNVYNCTLAIPSTITKIDDQAFNSGNNLTLQVEYTTPLVINENVFQGLNNSILRVPEGSRDAYAAATGWKNFETIMEGNEGAIITAQTTEGWDMVFTVLDDNAKTCQVGYINGSWDKLAVDKDAVNGAVTIPQTVEGYTVVKIGKYAFQNVYKMTSVTIPNTVTSIDEYAFSDCYNLISFELPASVIFLGDHALTGFSNATSIKVAEGNTKYDSRDNCNAIIETAINKLLIGCKNTIIPASVTEIGSWAFDNMNNCTLSIPSTITKIDDYAFSGGNNLTLQVEHTTPLQINENVFQYMNNSTLRVPAGRKATYAVATGWSKFDNIFEGNEGSTFTAKTTEGIDMIFTILDETEKTCQVGYLDGASNKLAVDKNAVNGTLTIPQAVNGYTVVKIGRYAFRNVYQMTSVTIPNTMTAIEEWAFAYCYGLTSFELPVSITRIGNYAFNNCRNMTLQVEHSTPLEIDENVFQNLSNSTLRVPAGSKAAYAAATGWNKFDTIMEGNEGSSFTAKTTEGIDMVFTILDDTEKTCQVGYINGASNKQAVGKNAVEGPVTIPETVNGYTVVKIGKYAFYDVYQMTSVTIPNTVTSIDEYAFSACSFLTSVTVEVMTPITISANVFTSRTNAKLYVPKGCKSAYQAADYWNEFKQIKELISPSEMFVFTANPDGTTCSVTGHTDYCIEDVTIPESWEGLSVTTIGDNALKDCIDMTSVIIPNSVTSIGEGAFANCSGLTSITIPISVTSIGKNAFGGSNNLTYVTVEAKTPITISDDVFTNKANATLYVPAGSMTAYLAAGYWNEFKEMIESEPATWTDNNGMKWTFTVSRTEAKDIKPATYNKTYIYGDPNKSDVEKPFQPAAWDAAAMRFSSTEGAHLPTISDEVYAGLKTLIFDVSDVTEEFDLKVMNGWWSATYYDHVKWTDGPNELLLTEDIYRDCAKSMGGRDLDLMLYDGSVTLNAVYYQTALIPEPAVAIPEKVNAGSMELTVTTIGERAFLGCNELTSITIPSGVTSIGSRAFFDCNGLTSVTVEAKTPIAIEENVFTDRQNKTLYVPVGSKAAYEAADYWKDFIIIEKSGEDSYVELDQTEIFVEKGKTLTLKATVYPETLEDKSVTWTSSDTKIATVSSSGKVKGVKTGTATITCTSNATGMSATCEVTVGTIKIDQTEIVLEKGNTMTLKATVYPSTLEDKSVTWTSSDKKIVTVSSDGEVKGVKTGTATITCTSNATGLSATCEVTVGSIKIDKAEIVLEKGKAMTLKSTVYPTTLEDKSVTWTSSDTKIATVSSDGEVEGLKTGIATITCTSNATGLSATCEVIVGTIKINKAEIFVEKGKTMTLTSTVYPLTLEDNSVTWTSSDTKIATVSSDGEVEGIKTGTATITCTSNATGLSATCKVTVGSIKINQTEIVLEKGNTLTLKSTVYPTTLEDKSVTWTSSDTKIATVSSSGKVKGVKTGTATITCTSNATGLSATCEVIVGSIKVDKTDIVVEKGKTLTLKSTVYPTTLEDKSVTWKSSDKSVATVSSSGKVKGIAPGTATITCTSNATGLSATCTVTVVAAAGTRTYEGGIDEMDKASEAVEPFDVYDMSGRKVRHQVTSLDGLPKGIYIVNGKKMLKK